VEISAIAHATEDVRKVEAAVQHVLPERHRSTIQFTRRYLEGHHGNEIVTVSAKVSDPRVVEEIGSRIGQLLGPTDRNLLSKSLETYLDDEGNLFLRFNKQEAFLGRLTIEQEDPIRVRMKFRSGRDMRESVMAFLRSNRIVE
jgi:hypothetical protein